VKLLKFEEAMEDRIESSHFSPPLSKQRIEYARIMINAVEAKTLVLDRPIFWLANIQMIHTGLGFEVFFISLLCCYVC